VRLLPSLKKKIQVSAKKNTRSTNAEFSRLLELGLEAEKQKK
jgi:plasmid stability protein